MKEEETAIGLLISPDYPSVLAVIHPGNRHGNAVKVLKLRIVGRTR